MPDPTHDQPETTAPPAYPDPQEPGRTTLYEPSDTSGEEE